jgi:hypothetical protein
VVDMVVGDHGVAALDDTYRQLVPASRNLGEVDYRALIAGEAQRVERNPAATFDVFRIGDAVEGRSVHAAVYDALRLCKDL